MTGKFVASLAAASLILAGSALAQQPPAEPQSRAWSRHGRWSCRSKRAKRIGGGEVDTAAHGRGSKAERQRGQRNDVALAPDQLLYRQPHPPSIRSAVHAHERADQRLVQTWPRAGALASLPSG
jgi:hypothetical protein